MDKTETTALVMVSIMIVMDYLTGLIKAAMQHDISSEKMRNGLYHKVSFVIVMFLAEIIERAQQSIDLGFSMPIVAPAASTSRSLKSHQCWRTSEKSTRN